MAGLYVKLAPKFLNVPLRFKERRRTIAKGASTILSMPWYLFESICLCCQTFTGAYSGTYRWWQFQHSGSGPINQQSFSVAWQIENFGHTTEPHRLLSFRSPTPFPSVFHSTPRLDFSYLIHSSRLSRLSLFLGVHL